MILWKHILVFPKYKLIVKIKRFISPEHTVPREQKSFKFKWKVPLGVGGNRSDKTSKKVKPVSMGMLCQAAGKRLLIHCCETTLISAIAI